MTQRHVMQPASLPPPGHGHADIADLRHPSVITCPSYTAVLWMGPDLHLFHASASSDSVGSQYHFPMVRSLVQPVLCGGE